MDNPPETEQLVHRMTEGLRWCEHIMGIDWSSGSIPHSDSLKYAIEARKYVAEAAADLKVHELVRELCSNLYRTDGFWRECSPEVQYAHASLVVFYANYRTRRVDAEPEEEGVAHPKDLLKIAIPYVDSLYQLEKHKQSRVDARLVRLRSLAYGYGIVSVRNKDHSQVCDLMQAMLAQVEDSPDISSARLALALAIDSLIEAPEKAVDPVELKTIVKTYFCEPSECQDGSSWLVGSVGLIGKLGAHLHPEDDTFYFECLGRLLAAWSPDCYREDNARYACFRSLRFLSKYLINHRELLSDERFLGMLRRLLAVPGRFGMSAIVGETKLFESVLNNAPPEFVKELLGRYTEPLERAADIAESDLRLYGEGLARLTNYFSDDASALNAWGFINQAPPEVQKVWFERMALLTEKELSPTLVRLHIDRLLAFSMGTQIDEENYQRWSEALVAMVSSAVAFNDQEYAFKAVDRCGTPGQVEDSLWPVLVSIVVVGEGRESPQRAVSWCRNLLNAASEVRFSETNCEPWLMATCTLAHELSAIRATDTEALIALHERILNAVREHEGASMDTDFLKRNDKRLARMLYQVWCNTDKQQAYVGQGLMLFDKLAAIEFRSPGSARNELKMLFGKLSCNGLNEHERYTEVQEIMDRLENPPSPVSRFEVANKPETREQEQVFADALQATAKISTESAPAPWTLVEDTEQKAHFLDQISPIDGKYRTSPETTSLAFCGLPWYESITLLRIQDPQWVNQKLAIYYLSDGSNLYRLNGTSPPIHEVNAKAPIRLTEDNVLGYLRFFCFFVRGDEGPFYVLEAADDPLVALSRSGPPMDHSATMSVLESSAKPARYLGKDGQGNYLCKAEVFYANAIFMANMVVKPDGMIEMVNDEPIAGDLSFRINQPIA